MESPIKKLDFNPANKENQPAEDNVAVPSKNANEQEQTKPAVEEVKAVEKTAQPAVAPGLRPEEADEPLLQDNPQRFVLFPIKYHEVSNASRRAKRVKVGSTQTDDDIDNHLDLANVQEGRGVLLDCRRDRPVEGSPRLEQPAQ